MNWIAAGVIVNTLALVIGGIKYYGMLAAFLETHKNFPPHRHSGDRILYPKGMNPNNGD